MRVYLYRWTIYEYNRVYGTRRGRARLSVRISVDRHKAACTLIALHAPPIDTIPLHADSEAQRGCAPLFARDYRTHKGKGIGTISSRAGFFSWLRHCSLLLLLRYSCFSKGVSCNSLQSCFAKRRLLVF